MSHQHEAPAHHDGTGFSSGVMIALVVLVLVVAVLLLFNFGPAVFNVNVRQTSWLEALEAALL
jgi:hypothetical protein